MRHSLIKKLTVYHLAFTLLIFIFPFLAFYNLWYPNELLALTGGEGILKIYIIMECILNTAIATVLFLSRNDSYKEIIIKYVLLCILQVSASFFGFKTLYEAKPIYIAYEFNQFRVVRPIDIQGKTNSIDFQSIANGPIIIGTKKLSSSDPEFLKSIKDSLNGYYPSFKVSRQISYKDIKNEVLSNAQNVTNLTETSLDKVRLFSVNHQLDINKLAYYPLTSYYSDEWITLINKENAEVVTYLKTNGWIRNE
ncbi:hypothetical protein [uncultured Pseudoalteromonas sp.]|uniref:hypothetical protein n=1 Tax=uncultured Pseudoalteromonas sp. TaxID=114053 RepID=UPI002592EEFF|nr:hypothetical protein [uncultured Pseudoalteromonas sp.]|tara:strand:- start:491 stop:1246 length:756 start_codon:yes stop_codon:yes gene_type:complete